MYVQSEYIFTKTKKFPDEETEKGYDQRKKQR